MIRNRRYEQADFVIGPLGPALYQVASATLALTQYVDAPLETTEIPEIPGLYWLCSATNVMPA